MRRHLCLMFSLAFALTGATSAARAAGAGAPRVATTAATKSTTTKVKAKGKALYTARVTSATPLAVGLVIDQSGSNQHPIAGGDVRTTKAAALANALNANIEAMVAASVDGADEATGEPKFKPWFHVAGVGYSTGVRPLFGNGMAMHSTTELAKSAQWLDAAGNPTNHPEQYVSMKWVDPVAGGYTHMGEGLHALVPMFEKFVAEHPDAPAPIAMHFTDGRPEGGLQQHLDAAKKLRALKTKDGNVILFNVHVGETGGEFMFPNEKAIESLPETLRPDARRLFEMSSPMPPAMLARARAAFPEYAIADDARAMVYNAREAVLAKLLEMGTVQNMQSRK